MRERSSSQFDELTIYSLPQFSRYLVAVDCDRIKAMSDLTIKRLNDKNEIEELYDVLNNSSHFRTDTITQSLTKLGGIDTRIRFDFIKGGNVVKSICWSPRLIEKSG